MLEGKINIKRIRNDLDEFEMNELEAKVNAEIKILEKKENRTRKITRHQKIKIKIKRDGNNENIEYISKYISRRNKRYLYQI